MAQAEVRDLHWRAEDPFAGVNQRALAYGLGRSYGDSCLNDGGLLLSTRGLDRFVAFDPATGVLRCEAGVSLAEIIDLTLPQGWFPRVVPGTKHVTVGGAIANDIHGKNHHRAGTFGAHVRALELCRSDGSRRVCSREDSPELFAATVGGLGLTGVVTWAELQLRKVAGPYIAAETVEVPDLDHFFQVSAESDARFEYTVAWVDVLARGRHIGRGLFYRGNHAETPARPGEAGRGRLSVPFDLPSATLNRLTVSAFNFAYYRKNRRQRGEREQHLDGFFFPLDGVGRWNRIYGKRGLLQFQCAVPTAAAPEVIRELLGRIAAAGQGSFLAVLKTFGEVPSPGLLSFPRKGVTLALDFANRGPKTLELVRQLYAVARQGGGAFYPAKDAVMSPEDFAASYPRLAEFERHLDPACSSGFWRRVREGHPYQPSLPLGPPAAGGKGVTP
ncbi:FAD-binding oxidoreductase [Anaeromyxobacter paludicola]|uniref:FAD-binding oxidoreductase n=1 Tax=Anaeromyxobacter paludicola TaxID=2918171 RepID=UPI0020C019DC|nr:FAD-binding oxidoreductase [Anaeromyxobacter paludicola]